MRWPGRPRGVLAALLLGAAVAAPLASASEAAATITSQARTALPDSLPLLREAPPPVNPEAWGTAWLLLALAGGAGGWWWWRRLAGRAGGRLGRETGPAVVRLSSQPLTPQASVHAVQWRGEEFLIACTGQQVTLLSRTPVAAGQQTP